MPLSAAMISVDVIASRSSGAAASSTMPVVPLKTRPAPAPISAPPTKNSVRLGVGRRTAVTSSTRPTTIDDIPRASTREARSLDVASWDTTPEEKTTKSVAPERACEGRWSVVAKKSPDLLIQAFARWQAIRKANGAASSAMLVIAGPDEGGYQKQLEAISAQLGLSKAVLFPGPLFDDAKWSAYRDADLFVLPSQNENFGVENKPVLVAGGTPF